MNPFTRFLIPLLGLIAFAGGSLHAQQFNWGSVAYSDLVDSNGNTLDNTYVFELGSFVTDFIPDENNIHMWHENWMAFDSAAYNGLDDADGSLMYGAFTSTANMNPDGTSDSPGRTSPTFSFEGLEAYIWIRNSNLAQPGSEWMLARADWVFPEADLDCCGNNPPTEWSTSDLNVTLENGDTLSYTPVWGAQGTQTGGGTISSPGSYTLQTATFVPEPSTPLLFLMAGLLLCGYRKR